jgi:Glycoside Hydrolase Family 113
VRSPVEDNGGRLRAGQPVRRAATAAVAGLLLLGPTACSAPGSVGGGKARTGGIDGASQSAAGQSARPTPAEPEVTFPWRAGRPQLGMNVYWADDPSDSEAVVRAKARRVVDYLITIDANSVALAFPFFTAGPTASSVFATSATPSARRVGVALDEFSRRGLRATLKPLLDEKALLAVSRRSWRGSIQPANRDAWFATYRKLLVPYLHVAQRSRARTFVIGTELSSLESDPRWGALAGQAKGIFRADIAYSVNWDSYVSRPNRMPVDEVGVDAYFPLEVDDDAPTSVLVAGWNRWLDRRAVGPLPDLSFSEVGAPAEDGAYRHPAAWGSTRGHALNLAVQARWFTAACQVARQRKMAGLYWWKVDFHDDPVRADPVHDKHDSFLGRPGEDAIQSCFSAWGSSTR